MTNTPQLSCRLHSSTGRLSCAYPISGRSVAAGALTSSEEAAQRSRIESNRRARRRVEELIYDNDLCQMWTLSYNAAPADRAEVVITWSAFTRRLRRAHLSLPRLAVPEQGHATGRWHLHMAVPASPDAQLMSSLWSFGDVWVPDLERANQENALAFLSGYLTKSFDSSDKGSRRYFTSAGLRTKEQRFSAPNAHAALAAATGRFGAPPVRSGWYGGRFTATFEPAVRVGAS